LQKKTTHNVADAVQANELKNRSKHKATTTTTTANRRVCQGSCWLKQKKIWSMPCWVPLQHSQTLTSNYLLKNGWKILLSVVLFSQKQNVYMFYL